MEPVLKADLVADIKSLQDAHPDQRITRNFYRHHGRYGESQWQYHFPTFKAFLEAAGLGDLPQQHVQYMYPVHDEPIPKLGDIVNLNGERHKVVEYRGCSVRTKRHYWFHDLWERFMKG